MDRSETLETIVYLQSLFPSLSGMAKEKADAMAYSWGEMFSDAGMGVDRVHKAILRYSKETDTAFPPSASQVYAIACEIKPDAQKSLPQPKRTSCPYGFCDGNGQVGLKDRSGRITAYECPCQYDRQLHKAQITGADEEVQEHLDKLRRQAHGMMDTARGHIEDGWEYAYGAPKRGAQPYWPDSFEEPVRSMHRKVVEMRMDLVGYVISKGSTPAGRIKREAEIDAYCKERNDVAIKAGYDRKRMEVM